MFYIHIADPTYADPDSDFPFGRRLGPFLTKKEAVAQAASDIAGGTGEGIVGVYSGGESEKARDGAKAFDVAVDRDELDGEAELERERRRQVQAAQEKAVDADYAAGWEALLGAVKDPAVLEIAEQLRERTMPK